MNFFLIGIIFPAVITVLFVMWLRLAGDVRERAEIDRDTAVTPPLNAVAAVNKA